MGTTMRHCRQQHPAARCMGAPWLSNWVFWIFILLGTVLVVLPTLSVMFDIGFMTFWGDGPYDAAEAELNPDDHTAAIAEAKAEAAKAAEAKTELAKGTEVTTEAAKDNQGTT